MIIYIVTIIVGMVLIAGLNIVFNSTFYSLPIYYIILAVVISTVAVIAIDGLFAFLIRRLPKKWFHHDKKCFIVGKRELKFYDAIGIRKWKDKILELGQFTNFTKKKVVDPFNNDYVTRFLLECNYGYIIHLACVFVGFLIIFFFPLQYALMFGVPVAIINAVLNLMPMFILRYNVPKLKILFLRNARKENILAKQVSTEQEFMQK